MKKIFVFVLGLMLALSPFVSALYAEAATITWADSVSDFNQGNQKDGNSVDTSRSDPLEALGANDGVFVSLAAI